jgi:predicted metal-dependent phosphotriesterase family hydrolase
MRTDRFGLRPFGKFVARSDESHFQLDGFTTFARGARAIIDADRNLYRGRNAETLRRVFHRRGIGPVE